MIYKTPPNDFKNKFNVVGCFCIQEDKILLLHRQGHKPQGNTWGVPAGKADGDETLLSAVQRELDEETGLKIETEKLIYLDKKYIRYPELDFTFYMYKTLLVEKPMVTINQQEHKAFVWITPQDSHILPLMEDIGECIEQYCK